MVTKDQVKAGICRFADAEIMEKVSGFNKLLLGAVIMSLPSTMDNIIEDYKSILETMCVIDSDERIDIDKAEDMLLASATKYGATVIEFKGLKMSLGCDDIRKAAHYIRNS